MYPAKIMKDFQEVRAKGESLLNQSKLTTSFIRPWYVLVPGHWWSILLKPFYLTARMIPSEKEAAEKPGTISIRQMIDTLGHAIKSQPLEILYYKVGDMHKFKFPVRVVGRELFEATAPHPAG